MHAKGSCIDFARFPPLFSHPILFSQWFCWCVWLWRRWPVDDSRKIHAWIYPTTHSLSIQKVANIFSIARTDRVWGHIARMVCGSIQKIVYAIYQPMLTVTLTIHYRPRRRRRNRHERLGHRHRQPLQRQHPQRRLVCRWYLLHFQSLTTIRMRSCARCTMQMSFNLLRAKLIVAIITYAIMVVRCGRSAARSFIGMRKRKNAFGPFMLNAR